MTAVVLQPSYIPWRGVFDLIARADVFVFYDDVQYDRGGWRNRNRIKTPRGSEWLTIPVHAGGNVSGHRSINSIEIAAGKGWRQLHLDKIAQSYRGAPHYERVASLLEPLYATECKFLADFTIASTKAIAAFLGLTPVFLRSSELGVEGRKTERLINVLRAVGADRYISGPSAQSYIELDLFAAAKIELMYIDYAYREYRQLFPPFDPSVSIVDTLCMLGPSTGEIFAGSTLRSSQTEPGA